MPKKINVVSLSDIKPTEEDVSIGDSNDERTQITEAIKEEEALNPPEEVQPMEEVKAKPKRKPPAKKAKVIEEVPQVVEPVIEPVVEVKKETTPKKVKTLELVKCEKCNKEMTKRTLRYDHDKTCKGAPIKREDVPVQKRVKKVVEEKQPTPQVVIPEHIIEQTIKTLKDRVEKLRELGCRELDKII